MLVTENVDLIITANNEKYWQDKGYDLSCAEVIWRKKFKFKLLTVQVKDLPRKSAVKVQCVCNKCGTEFIRMVRNSTDYCRPCQVSVQMKGNTWGRFCTGEKHGNWNPNKTAFKAYAYEVRLLSEKTYARWKHIINPDDLPRTLCGVSEGYQLDHVVSIKECFDAEVQPDKVADLENLQMLPWEDNRSKW